MPAKSEFKFNCPNCGQHILSATEWSGRKVNCPACQTKITIPAPPEATPPPAPVPAFTPATHPNYANKTKRVELPVKGSKPAAAKPPPQFQPAPATGPAPSKTSPPAPVPAPLLRVAVLTEEIKLDIVRAVRRRLTRPSAWLPDGIHGKYSYAAKLSRGETVLVEATDPEATRFSLIGAFLLEFHLRRVVQTALGREKLLDLEIPDAIHEVLTRRATSEERERLEHAPAGESLMNLSHSQCLETLDVLEQRYSQRMDYMRAEAAKEFLSSVRLPDLVKKLEKKAHVTPEEVATALYLELVDVRRRLDRLESRVARGLPVDKKKRRHGKK